MSASGAHDERFGAGSVSRSGRVRKKNSLLAGYESLDALEKPKRKSDKSPRSRDKDHAPAKVTLKIGGETPKRTPKRPAAKRVKMETKIKVEIKPSLNSLMMDDEGDLEMDLPAEFEGDMPCLAAEEIIDEGLLDEEDGATEITEHTSLNRLKSQAESTYMMEKTLEKIRKSTIPTTTISKTKTTRKDKGNPRITAYMLWAKDHRANFTKKNPHLDFTSVSKKLGELWATVPQNQRKMWKNRAAKMMRKNAHIMENRKNSGVSSNPSNNVTTKSVVVKKTPVLAKSVKTPKPSPKPKDAVIIESVSTLKSGSKAKGGGRKPSPVVVVTEQKKQISPPTKGGTKGQQKSTKLPSAKSNNVGLNLASSEFTHQTNVHIKNERKSPVKSTNNNHNTNINSMTNNVNVSTMQAVSHTSPSPSKNVPGSPTSKQMPQHSPRKEDDVPLYKVTGTAPIDVSAHFSLLGESLSIIGERLKDVEGQTVSGSLSVLLDSLLCATGPLLCLTQQVPELNCIPPEKLGQLLDNIAYVMPGL